MIKRIFDLVFSIFAILGLFGVFLLISFLVKLSSSGPIIYKQLRVGRGGKNFNILKFRTMYLNSEEKGLLTIGSKDARVTKIGYFLRKYKLDELPQVVNVFIGNMSVVGPRPEVRRFVDLYNKDQLKVLCVKPGITDIASIEFRNENDLLASSGDPEKYYIEMIMPKKLDINMKYLRNRSLLKDIEIVLLTIKSIF